MNSAKLLQRATWMLVGCALLFASSALAAPSASTKGRKNSSSSTRAAEGRALINKSAGGVGISVAHNSKEDRIAIDTDSSKPIFKVTKLSNPPRLVIDLTSQRISSSRSLPIADLDYVSTIRLGAHPTTGRIVLDLAQGQDISHSVNEEGGRIIVTVSGSQQASNTLVPSMTDRRPTQNLVTGLKLSASEGNSSSVLIEVEKTPEFNIRRTAPSEYVLTLKNTGILDKTLSQPMLTTSQSTAIRSVRPSINGSDTLVRIFSRPDVYLTARGVGSRVLVEETKDLRQVVEDMRAQLAPEKTPQAAPEKTPQVAGEKTPVPAKPAANPNTPSSDKKVEPKIPDPAKNPESKKAKLPSESQKVNDPASSTKNPTAPKKAEVEEMSDAEVRALLGDTSRYTGKLISLDLQDTDIDNALRIIAEVSNLNIVASEEVVGKVTLRLTDVPWDQALDVILKNQGLDRVLEGNVMRIAPMEKLALERKAQKAAQVAETELAPLNVKYLRVSYGKASELKSLVETVLSERGTVAYDERSNQLIVKDIQAGIANVTELVSKVDLRTPQVLLETQIVEATRNLSRTLGSELGFQYIQSPATGNGTGLNFPSAISVGGSVIPGGAVPNITTSAFPAPSTALGGSAISMLFDSADGTKTLELRLSQLEQEGKVRIVSRPAVATTNNKAAEIKSVERYRVKLPSGGTSVATGQGSVANGTGGSATEIIEAGIILNVTPQASPDYYILLDIRAKSSSFGAKSVDGIPNEIERSASSSVLVSSGQTFALGGIYKISDNDNVTGMPFFKDIPVLGTFFRRSAVDNSDEELLFFITPRIVEGSFDDSSMKVPS